MDARLYMLGAIALVLLALAVYVLIAFSRYRRAVRQALKTSPTVDDGAREAYLGDAAEQADDVFAVRVGASDASGAVGEDVAAESQPEIVRPRLDERDIPPVYRDVPVVEITVPVEPVVPSVPEPEPEPVPEPEPDPEPALAPPLAAPPDPPASDVYSLAEDLERLMAAAAQPATLLTPEEHERALLGPPAVDEGGPIPDVSAFLPLAPGPSLGQALSSVPVPPAAERLPAVDPAVSSRAVETSTAAGPGRDVAYALVAPVELHFAGGGARVGVRAGTRTYDEFQRLASILLGDLRKARGW
ncbi:MAG: hypothetical protein Q7W44_08180 [Coriobacteriia bacterium]|nr:hypothetical protein [Coriobacteriia bacterium]